MTRLTFGGTHHAVLKVLGQDLCTEKVVELRNELLRQMRNGPAVRAETIDTLMREMEAIAKAGKVHDGIRLWLEVMLETEVAR